MENLHKELKNILEEYEKLGLIVKDEKGFNILDTKNKEMLDKPYPSLKKMLQDIVNYL